MRAPLSLRARLLIAVGAITLVALVVADVVVYAELGSYLDNQTDMTLQISEHAVEAALRTDGGPNPASRGPGAPGIPPGQAPIAGDFCAAGLESAPGMFIAVLNPTGIVATGPGGNEDCPAFQPGKKSYSPKLPKPITGFSTPGSGNGREPTVSFTAASTVPGGPAFRVRAEREPGGRILVLATPIVSITNTLSQLLLVELLVTGGALVAALLLGLWLVRIGLRPLRDVERTAEAIAGGDLVHRVPNANTRTEVGHVATALNVMLEQIETAFGQLQRSENRLRRFVADASHELRTPIAAVSAYAQLFGQGAWSRTEDLARVMTGIERESARMTQLVEDLLHLAKLDEDEGFPTEPVELVGLAVEALETARTVGPQWPVDLVADGPVEVAGDSGALREVLDNLLSNVRAHTPPGTRATITVGRDDVGALIEVADEGPGISAEQATTIFERFFRVDRSRSRETGGSGLGLAIVASIVAAHHGRVEAIPRPGGGALFRVHLPVLAAETSP